MTDLAAELSRAIQGEVRFDSYARALYSTDASAYQIEPIGVVIPRQAEDVQAALEIAARRQAPVLARGGGTSLAGQAVGAALVLDLSKYLRQIVEINADERWVRVQPGVVCDTLNAKLKPLGLMLGPDPASSNRATLGGMLMNNATGAHSIRYGMMADHILATQVFLDDGTPAHFATLDPSALAARVASAGREAELYRALASLVTQHSALIQERFPKTWRRASGYSLNYLLPHSRTSTQPSAWPSWSTQPYPPVAGFNLAHLLAGSEGTLAVATELTLNLVPRPKCTGLCVINFDSVALACEATPAVLECQPSAVELIDALMIRLTRAVPAYARQLTFIEGDPGAILVVEFFGETDAHLIAQIEKLEHQLRGKGLAKVFLRALTSERQSQVWGIRKVGLGLITSMRGDAKPAAFMEDVAVPVDQLGSYVRTVEALFREFGVDSAYYAHASAGCLHIRPILNLKRAEDVAKMRAMGAAVLNVVVAMGGALSGEHGDGLSRSTWNGQLFGPELYAVFQEVKRLFDPHQRLNPGKIVAEHGPDPGDNLRYGADYRAFELTTYLSFAKEGGFTAAVEQCSGIGLCRKADGVMCPSFMATQDEEHSTRGRANALRAALSGRLPLSDLTSARMKAVLDLCLECKACQSECPAGVDMAKIKYEFLAQYQAAHGVPLRSRVFGHIHRLSQLAQGWSSLLNPLLGWSVTRWINEQLVGIARQRTLPAFARRTFRQGFAQRPPVSELNHQPVILFVDTFTNFNHPEIGLAALRVLEAAGYAVNIVEHGCCGRPLISKGLLTEAKQAAHSIVDALAPYAEQGVPIIGLEPSCLLTLRDEYLDLLPNDSRAKNLARQARLIEEFLSEQPDLPFHWKSDPRHVRVHGHCYQKALTGTAPLLRMLRLPGWDVSEIDSGCCGMAGSFGYEVEHYVLSQQIGEDRLFPAVRAAEPGTAIAASGMSCRYQILHGTGRVAHHPIQLLAEALV